MHAGQMSSLSILFVATFMAERGNNRSECWRREGSLRVAPVHAPKPQPCRAMVAGAARCCEVLPCLSPPAELY